ncbi:MAG: ribokinase [Nocardioidaceae bacterium]
MLGSFMMDLITQAPRRPERGETLIGTGFAQHLGGKGLNQAVAAARSGADVHMIGAVGDDEYGAQFLDRLGAEGIDATHVMTTGRGTGVGLPLVEPNGENSIVVVPRANLAVTPEDVRAAEAAFATADLLLLQQELPLDSIREAARIAHEAGTSVMLNPAPALEGTRDMRGLVDILVPNEYEARTLSGDGEGTAEALGKALLEDWSLAQVVLTLGSAGALVVDRDGATTVRPHVVEAIDTIGAGDTFCGTLAARLACGEPFADAAAYANVAAAISVTRTGGADAVPMHEAVLAALG